jgi:hypothetical protein
VAGIGQHRVFAKTRQPRNSRNKKNSRGNLAEVRRGRYLLSQTGPIFPATPTTVPLPSSGRRSRSRATRRQGGGDGDGASPTVPKPGRGGRLLKELQRFQCLMAIGGLSTTCLRVSGLAEDEHGRRSAPRPANHAHRPAQEFLARARGFNTYVLGFSCGLKDRRLLSRLIWRSLILLP